MIGSLIICLSLLDTLMPKEIGKPNENCSQKDWCQLYATDC